MYRLFQKKRTISIRQLLLLSTISVYPMVIVRYYNRYSFVLFIYFVDINA